MELDVEVVDPMDCVRDTMETVREQAEAKELRLTLTEPDQHLQAKVDDRYLRQVLLNLLSNAIKFTPAGGFIQVVPVVTEAGGLDIHVMDSGIGIAKENLEVAMAKFGQVASAFARDHQGTGLGLPLSKKLMELHGGDLTLQSEVGAGTTATIALPPERIVSRQLPDGSAKVFTLPASRPASVSEGGGAPRLAEIVPGPLQAARTATTLP
jgi:signal transduction histidine kinase